MAGISTASGSRFAAEGLIANMSDCSSPVRRQIQHSIKDLEGLVSQCSSPVRRKVQHMKDYDSPVRRRIQKSMKEIQLPNRLETAIIRGQMSERSFDDIIALVKLAALASRASDAKRPSAMVMVKKGTCEGGVGLKLEVTKGSPIVIEGVVEKGPVWNYNQSVKEERQINIGDFLISVNGVRGDADRLMQEVHSGLVPMLGVSKPLILEITVDKKATECYGMSLQSSSNSKALVVSKVMPGAVARFNDRFPEKAIKQGDRILSVNGVDATGDAMLAALRTTSAKMTVTRPHFVDQYIQL